MNPKFLSLIIFLIFFNFISNSNLFFQWRITDAEKKQLEKETFELIRTNLELYKKIVSNYETRSEELDRDITLKFSRYTHCQKCLLFVKQFKSIKEKFGFPSLIKNLKEVVCPLIKFYDEEVCRGIVDKYGYIILESFFAKFFRGYFFAKK